MVFDSFHLESTMDSVIASILFSVTAIIGKSPQYRVHGGSQEENVALQNLQVGMHHVTMSFEDQE